jgi:hypothetical protein
MSFETTLLRMRNQAMALRPDLRQKVLQLLANRVSDRREAAMGEARQGLAEAKTKSRTMPWER